MYVFFFFLFFFKSHPVSKNWYWLNRKNYCMYNTDHIKMHPLWLSSRQDKTSIKLLVEHEQSPTDYQTRKITQEKIFFFSSLFFWIKTISIEMQSYHTVKKKKKKKSTSEYENNRRKKVIVRAWTGFVMEAPEVSQIPGWDRCGLYIVLFYSFTVTLHHTPQIATDLRTFQCSTHNFIIFRS